MFRACRGPIRRGRPGFLVVRETIVKIFPRGFRHQLRQQRLDGGADIADKAEVELAAPAEIFRPDIDLGYFGIVGEKLLVGKIGSQHQQHVAGVHGGIAGGKTDEPGHADVIGIVVFDMVLAAERMHDRALERLRKFHQAAMGAGTTAPAEQRDALGAVQEVGQSSNSRFSRPHDRCCRQQPGIGCNAALGSGPQRDVAGNDQHGNAAFSDCRANSVFQHIRKLRRIGNQLAVVAAFPEQFLRMGLLKVAATDFAGRKLGRDRQHRGAAAVGIEQTVDEMKVAGPARPGTHRKFPR